MDSKTGRYVATCEEEEENYGARINFVDAI